MWIGFEDKKIDCPNSTAKYIILRTTGRQKYKTPLKWAKNHIRFLRRLTAKIVETYGIMGYTECWDDSSPQSDQYSNELDVPLNTHKVRRTSKKRKKIVEKIPRLKYGIRIPKDTK